MYSQTAHNDYLNPAKSEIVLKGQSQHVIGEQLRYIRLDFAVLSDALPKNTVFHCAIGRTNMPAWFEPKLIWPR